MAFQSNPQLNLASILQNLSNSAQASGQAPLAAYAAQYSTHLPQRAPSLEQSQYPYQGYQNSFERVPTPAPQQVPTPVQPIEHESPSRPAMTANDRPSSTPPVDPRSIVSWPPALRLVTKLMTQNEGAAAQVRRMIQQQHKHEREWHRSRQALVETQQNRKAAEDKVADVLRAVGGLVGESKPEQTPEEAEREMRNYDAKVHRACRDMSKSMSAELEALGIPFFGISPKLVAASPDVKNPIAVDSVDVDGRLPQEKLTALKRKMVELLEDMCKD